ncbi:CRISPR-associated protein, Cas1 family [Desulfocicer vacuolatum DSM 3385]|uniref:CRISPR-associated endonuclease Cas1 n=1 Tax=Desulfocicer vacuolatum DSM 3385 TaxID=1121400 RepID=A0A1W2E874_9BACT|nr:CRISPR-associated endonuclease Cas1 [Desulfocicer vacuolatum]SMD05973.1 CRISPR-associated protein, Cas1 family [Desulfocicer vacuolatum DSM 3385]
MEKMTLIEDRRDTTVVLDGKALKIKHADATMQRIPLGMVGQVIVYGSPQVSCDVWRVLSELGVAAVLLPSRGTGASAWLGAGISTSIMVRIKQYRAWNDSDVKLRVVSWLLQGKITGVRTLLNSLTHNGSNGFLRQAIQSVKITNRVTKAGKKSNGVLKECLHQLGVSKSIDSSRGVEGAAAKEWFGFLAVFLSKKWKFKGRNRRPPKDPVNALLSLSYTLLMSEIRKEVNIRGLDPALGFLHSPYPGRESLILDIAEPLRPGVDAFVLNIIGELSPGHFTTSGTDGCRISKEGRKIYFFAWEEWKKKWPILDLTSEDGLEVQSLKFYCTKMIEGMVGLW